MTGAPAADEAEDPFGPGAVAAPIQGRHPGIDRAKAQVPLVPDAFP